VFFCVDKLEGLKINLYGFEENNMSIFLVNIEIKMSEFENKFCES